MNKFIFACILIFLTASGCGKNGGLKMPAQSNPARQPAPPSKEIVGAPAPKGGLSEPISGALQRVTKKPFGIYITPATSPVQPEKFKGFHTGTDFETFSGEADAEVPVFAACDGKLLSARSASGYGGVLVQSCKLNAQDVTVIYGHIRLTSVINKAGETLKSGQTIAVLGRGETYETDGERKHLHFGIHKGLAINIAGYVQNKEELTGWINPMDYIK